MMNDDELEVGANGCVKKKTTASNTPKVKSFATNLASKSSRMSRTTSVLCVGQLGSGCMMSLTSSIISSGSVTWIERGSDEVVMTPARAMDLKSINPLNIGATWNHRDITKKSSSLSVATKVKKDHMGLR
jgi:hypothetical protein